MKRTLVFAAMLLALAGCQSLKEEFQPVFTLDYDNPPAYDYYTDADFDQIITIADLAATYTIGKPYVVKKDITIKGRVTTTDQPGNFYKSFYIQDETGGMEIKIGKNGLYNDYLPGQTVYVNLKGLTVGMYGYKSGNYGGMGMVQVGFSDPSGEYETSYMELALLIDQHVKRGNPADIKAVEPVVLTEDMLPNGKNATQKTNKYVGGLVTLKGLTYADEIFCLLYLDSNKDKKSYTNRIFLSDSNGTEDGDLTHKVTTWAMSKSKMKEYLYNGYWDTCKVGSGSEYTGQTVADLKGDGTYPSIEKNAYSISQYFTMGSTEIQVRTSGFSKFCDREIPAEVLSGAKEIDITGILTIYQGSIQFVVNNISDIAVDGKPLN